MIKNPERLLGSGTEVIGLLPALVPERVIRPKTGQDPRAIVHEHLTAKEKVQVSFNGVIFSFDPATRQIQILRIDPEFSKKIPVLTVIQSILGITQIALDEGVNAIIGDNFFTASTMSIVSKTLASA